MHPVLERALAPVLRDLRGSGLVPPVVEDRSWTEDEAYPSVTMHADDGSAMGLSVGLWWGEPERVAWVADRVHDWAVEELGRLGHPTSWPPCAVHPDSHPLVTQVVDEQAVWACPRLGTAQALIGSLDERERFGS